MHTIKASELQRQSADVLQRVRSGETVAITHYRKPIAKVVPAEQPTDFGQPDADLPADLAEAVDAYATTRGITAAEAVQAILAEKLLKTPTSMWAVIPEAETAADLEHVISEERGDGEAVEYEYGGRFFCLSYSKVRRHWFLELEEPVDPADTTGEWKHTYTICKNKAEAQRRYREVIIAESAAWDPDSGADGMWFDAWDATFDAFVKLGSRSPVPLASFGAEE